MRILRFIVHAQSIRKDPKCDFSGLVSGTKGYLMAEFSVSPEWDGCQMAAVFTKLNVAHARPVANGRCEIPPEALTWERFGVRLVGQRGEYRITTNEVTVEQERV